MTNLSSQLKEVEHLIRTKHQAGRHSQSSHTPKKYGKGGAGGGSPGREGVDYSKWDSLSAGNIPVDAPPGWKRVDLKDAVQFDNTDWSTYGWNISVTKPGHPGPKNEVQVQGTNPKRWSGVNASFDTWGEAFRFADTNIYVEGELPG